MGVTLECYRMRIGCHQPRYLLGRQSRVENLMCSSVTMSKYLMTISFLGYACSKSMPRSVENDFTSFQWQPGLMGFGLDATNKICHMLTGNENINGINLASWNCARTLTEKIEDIKLFIENYKRST